MFSYMAGELFEALLLLFVAQKLQELVYHASLGVTNVLQHTKLRADLCRNQKKAEAAAKEVARAGGSKNTVPFYAADLASLDETKALAQQVQKDHPSLDILVNNAGGPMLDSYSHFNSCQPSVDLEDCMLGACQV